MVTFVIDIRLRRNLLKYAQAGWTHVLFNIVVGLQGL